MAPKRVTKKQNSETKNIKKASLKPKKAKPNTSVPNRYLRMKCPICFENLERDLVRATKCGHVFCSECLQKALKWASVCPTCRTKLHKGTRGHHPLHLSYNDCCGDVDLQEPETEIFI